MYITTRKTIAVLADHGYNIEWDGFSRYFDIIGKDGEIYWRCQNFRHGLQMTNPADDYTEIWWNLYNEEEDTILFGVYDWLGYEPEPFGR